MTTVRMMQQYVTSHPQYRTSSLFRGFGMTPADVLHPLLDKLYAHARHNRIDITDETEFWDVYNQMIEQDANLEVTQPRCSSCRGMRVDVRSGGTRLCRTCNGTNREIITIELLPVEPPPS